MEIEKISVNFFQRKPHFGANYSIEFIFDDLRKRLESKIISNIFISTRYNTGFFSKLINIIEAKKRFNGGISHITGETHFLNLLMNYNKVILTIHDCGVLRRKKGLAKNIVKWMYLTKPIKKCAIVTTVSEITKAEIIKFTGCIPDKIRVIPVAVNKIYQAYPKIFNQEKPTILQIGTGYNKNLENLLKAIIGINCHLIIIGKLSAIQLQLLINYNIDFSNFINISNNELLEKYISCDIVSFISTFEGFGMPIIEANSVERVVITSNVSSMPEVAGNSAYFVSPTDVADIREGFLKIIYDKDLRLTLIKNGKLNKLRFDPNAIASMYFDLYSQLYYFNKS